MSHRLISEKPVAFQAPIVQAGRLSNRQPLNKFQHENIQQGIKGPEEMRKDSTATTDVYELAFTMTRDHYSHSVSPEPEYFTNTDKVWPKEMPVPNTSDRLEIDKKFWEMYTFLGIVQTPGGISGPSASKAAGRIGTVTNTIHTAGTFSTYNTSEMTIPQNATVYWSMVPTGGGSADMKGYLPRCWQAPGGNKFSGHKGHAFTRWAPNGSEELKQAREHEAIIGRSINRSAPGTMLHLMIA